MAYDEGVAQRVREQLVDVQDVSEKKMFGGLAFLINGNMACGVLGENLVVRMGNDAYDDVKKMPHTRDMNFTGKTMKSMIYVEPEGFEDDSDLEKWVAMGVDYVSILLRKL